MCDVTHSQTRRRIPIFPDRTSPGQSGDAAPRATLPATQSGLGSEVVDLPTAACSVPVRGQRSYHRCAALYRNKQTCEEDREPGYERRRQYYLDCVTEIMMMAGMHVVGPPGDTTV